MNFTCKTFQTPSSSFFSVSFPLSLHCLTFHNWFVLLFIFRFHFHFHFFLTAVECCYCCFAFRCATNFFHLYSSRWREFHRSHLSLSSSSAISASFSPLSLFRFYYYNNVIAIYPEKWAYTSEALQMDIVYPEWEWSKRGNKRWKGSNGRWGRRLCVRVCESKCY